MDNDTISRQAAIDAIKTSRCLVNALKKTMKLPSAQPEPVEAIPVEWIEEHIKWLKSLENAFSNMTAMNIEVMLKKWKEEQK